MNLILPALAAPLRLQLLFLLLLLLLICSCELVQPIPLPPVRRNIIKVHASGFLPFESDLVLPLGILRQLQAQERASRVLPSIRYAKPARRKTKPKVKQQVRLERAHVHGAAGTDAGIQLYNLIDDDGELLLNLRVHSDSGSHVKSHNGNSNLDVDKSAPWRPSKWRPTTSVPLITSSSPRPLPLHQYLSSGNSVEQAMTQQRRIFGARPTWIYH